MLKKLAKPSHYKYPIVNAKELIQKAASKKAAVGHFNAMNLIYIKAILDAASESKKSLIIAVTEAKLDFLGGMKNFADQVKNMIARYKNLPPITLHLDHAYSIANCLKAIDLGFSSVMYDGSQLPLLENIKNLNKLIPYAKKHNVTIEGEIGSVGGVEDGIANLGINASAQDIKIMQKVDIDLLAVGVGNIHGQYPSTWKELNWKLISELKQHSRQYLVLHGASGIPPSQIKKAISLGINKINVSSELNWAFANALREQFQNQFHKTKNWQDPRTIFKNPYWEVKQVIKKKLALFSN